MTQPTKTSLPYKPETHVMFVSRLLWRAAEQMVEAKEGRPVKRPENIEFMGCKEYRG